MTSLRSEPLALGETQDDLPRFGRAAGEGDAEAVGGAAVDVALAAVAAVDAVGIDVVAKAAEGGGVVELLGLVVGDAAGDPVIPHRHLEAGVEAAAGADGEDDVVDVAVGGEVDLRIAGAVGVGAEAFDGRVDDDAVGEAVVGDGALELVGGEALLLGGFAAVADEDVDAV